MVSSPILLDFQSSTPCLKEVVEEMSTYWMENFSNPSSKGNLSGLYASASLDLSRTKIQKNLNLNNKKIIFTSGATESNNLALFGFARNFQQRTGRYGNIITLSTEHKAVLEPLRKLKKEGFSITELNPESDGLILEKNLLNALRDDTFLISIMLGNNEIGVVQPIEKIFKICQENNIKFHTDAAQCLGYLPIKNFGSLANMITLSSHKIYGPKGIGLLIIDEDIQLNPLFYGGGQEFGYRSGTVPLPLIIGFSKAIELAIKNQKRNSIQLAQRRDTLMNGLLKKNSKILINGSIIDRLPHNLNLTLLDVNGSKFHKNIKHQIVCSSGSACSNGEVSHVLTSMGRSFKEAESSLRLSIGLTTTDEEIEKSIDVLTETITKLRK